MLILGFNFAFFVVLMSRTWAGDRTSPGRDRPESDSANPPVDGPPATVDGPRPNPASYRTRRPRPVPRAPRNPIWTGPDPNDPGYRPTSRNGQAGAIIPAAPPSTIHQKFQISLFPFLSTPIPFPTKISHQSTFSFHSSIKFPLTHTISTIS